MRRYALCIGNNNYQFLSPLACAVSDSHAVAEKLKKLNFDVDEFTDLNSKSLAEKVSSFSDKLKEYDVVLLFYAGHGFQINGDNLMIPVDFDKPSDEKLAKRVAFPLDDLMHWLNQYPEKTKIVILDACRQEYDVRGLGEYFVPFTAPQGSIIAFSTSPKQSAFEENGHGLYTRFLLEHMEDPRVSIETIFKRVRTLLAQETKGKQISWEHTSLIGEFYLNPNTIFDGTNYSSDALEDSQYVFDRESKIGIIVNGLKSYVWNLQNNAVCKIRNVDFKTVRADDLFVLGRNLYQATCGSSFTAQRFIDDFSNISYIPNEAKEHILNGMVYEVYYDRNGKLRENFKWNYAEKVIEYVESESFYNSCRFISTRLYNEEGRIFYVPGQNEKVEVSVDLLDKDDCDSVSDIKCKGISIYYDAYTGIKPVIDDIYAEIPKNQFEAELRRKMGVMPGYLKIDYHGVENDPKMKFLIPINGYITFPQYRDD